MRSILARVLLPCGFAAAAPASVRLSNGIDMPQVSLGTAGFDNATVADALVLAVDVGMVGVDTAFNYLNQVGVGKGLKRVNRSAIFVTTKTTDCLHHDIADVDACTEHTRTEVESDFSQLDVQYIDLLLLHGANTRTVSEQGACNQLSCSLNIAQWNVYEEYYKAGKVRAIGVSNYCRSCLECVLSNAEIKPMVNQLQFHIGMTADPEGIMSYLENHTIVPMAYSPMGSGMAFTDPVATQISEAHGKTPAQVSLKWITDKGYTLTTKSNGRKHLEEDLDLFSWTLADEERQRLDRYRNSSDLPSWACTANARSGAVVV